MTNHESYGHAMRVLAEAQRCYPTLAPHTYQRERVKEAAEREDKSLPDDFDSEDFDADSFDVWATYKASD